MKVKVFEYEGKLQSYEIVDNAKDAGVVPVGLDKVSLQELRAGEAKRMGENLVNIEIRTLLETIRIFGIPEHQIAFIDGGE